MEYLLKIDRNGSELPFLKQDRTFVDQKRFFFRLDDGKVFQKFIAVPFLEHEIENTLFELKIIGKDSYKLLSCGELHELDYYDNEIETLKKYEQLSLLYTSTSFMYKYLKEGTPHLIFMSLPLLDDKYCHKINSPIPTLSVTML